VGQDSKQDNSEHEAEMSAKITVKFANPSQPIHTPVFVLKGFNDDKIYKL
jgi:hypothetical protein